MKIKVTYHAVTRLKQRFPIFNKLSYSKIVNAIELLHYYGKPINGKTMAKRYGFQLDIQFIKAHDVFKFGLTIILVVDRKSKSVITVLTEDQHIYNMRECRKKIKKVIYD